MEMTYILLQILLGLTQHPLSELAEVKSLVTLVIGREPFDKVLKVIRYFILIEYSINHMATEQFEFKFVFGMRVDAFVVMKKFKEERDS